MHITSPRWTDHRSESKIWIEKGARAGHIAKGVIYGLIGVLALQAALGVGGQVGGSEDAVRFVHEQPFGQVLLILLGVGLSGYAVWRFIVGFRDTERAGQGAKGWAKRAGAIASGVINAGLAVLAFQTVFAERAGGGGAKSWVGAVLAQPFGGALVALVGAGIVIAAVFQFYQAYSRRFLAFFELGRLDASGRRWLTRLGQWGHVARGVVFAIIGVACIRAGAHENAGETKGTGEALREVATSDYGQWLLVLVAAGFIAFAAFSFMSAKYRRVPA